MQRFLKIIFWTSIFFISFFIVVAILGRFVKVEFISNKTEYLFETVRFFGIPIAILLTLSRFIKRKDNATSIFGKVLLMIIISGISVFFLTISVFVSMCSWTTNKTLYIKKSNDSIKIVKREFGCGATDS